jgi:serine/threonine protein kinase
MIIKVVGKGSYGKVLLVRRVDDQRIYAMKVLKKKHMIKRNQVEHIKTERRVLVNLF